MSGRWRGRGRGRGRGWSHWSASIPADSSSVGGSNIDTPAPNATTTDVISVKTPSCPFATTPPLDAYDTMTTVIVGTGAVKQTFYVYKGLLGFYSSFFRSALNGGFREAVSKTVELPEDDIEVFQAFYNWLNQRKFYSEDAVKDGKIPLEVMTICKIFVFADARGIPQLQNAAIDVLFQKLCQDWIFPTNVLQFVYDNTFEGSALRKFLVNDAAETYGFKDLPKEPEGYPRDFLADVIGVFRETERSVGNCRPRSIHISEESKKLCQYHDHSDGSGDPKHPEASSYSRGFVPTADSDNDDASYECA